MLGASAVMVNILSEFFTSWSHRSLLMRGKEPCGKGNDSLLTPSSTPARRWVAAATSRAGKSSTRETVAISACRLRRLQIARLVSIVRSNSATTHAPRAWSYVDVATNVCQRCLALILRALDSHWSWPLHASCCAQRGSRAPLNDSILFSMRLSVRARKRSHRLSSSMAYA